MEIFGNVDNIKESIKQKYEKDINEIKSEVDKIIAAKKQEAKKQAEIKKSNLATVTDFEVKKEYSKILSEEKLKAKRDFESAREELIETIFKEAEKKATKIAHSKDYINFVKKKMPENCIVIADSNFFKKYFDKIEIDKTIIGIKCKLGNVVYDFSLDGIIKSKREELRLKISKILFK